MVSINLSDAVVGTLAFLTMATASPQPDFPAVCGAKGVQVRLPPAIRATPSTWKSYSADWYYKPWNMVYASHTVNLALRNFQFDPTPIKAADPNTKVNDLSSFQIPGNSTVFSSYGVDTPYPKVYAAYSYAGSGLLKGATSEYSVLAWGCDFSNYAYYVNYATKTDLTKTPAGIDIMSTFDKGLDQATFDAIVKALKALGNAEISAMAAALKRTTQDRGRDGQKRIKTCDAKCKSNENLKYLLG